MKPEEARTSGPRGRLVVVGTGIQTGAHLTQEARYWLKRADRVLYVVADPVSEALLRDLNPTAQSLAPLYQEGQPRTETYRQMIEQTLMLVEQGFLVCLAAYGHPGVFAHPTHAAIRLARMKGYEASMLPGISTQDCLFAELGVDPATHGCQSFEATDFLVRRRRFDPSVPLILWQVNMLGEKAFRTTACDPARIAVLVEVLKRYYGPDHEVVCYRTAQLPVEDSVMLRVPLSELGTRPETIPWTLYVPPCEQPPLDEEMAKLLGQKAGG